MDRSVKGVYLQGLIEQLKTWQHQTGVEKIPDLDLDEETQQRLFENCIMSSSWYKLENFWRVLESVFQLIYGGTTDGLQKMGFDGAKSTAKGPQRFLIKKGDPWRTLDSLPLYWNLSYNFGQVSVERDKSDYIVTLKDYPDIPQVHALLHVGYVRHILMLAGAQGVICKASASLCQDSSHEYFMTVRWQGLEFSD